LPARQAAGVTRMGSQLIHTLRLRSSVSNIPVFQIDL